MLQKNRALPLCGLWNRSALERSFIRLHAVRRQRSKYHVWRAIGPSRAGRAPPRSRETHKFKVYKSPLTIRMPQSFLLHSAFCALLRQLFERFLFRLPVQGSLKTLLARINDIRKKAAPKKKLPRTVDVFKLQKAPFHPGENDLSRGGLYLKAVPRSSQDAREKEKADPYA